VAVAAVLAYYLASGLTALVAFYGISSYECFLSADSFLKAFF